MGSAVKHRVAGLCWPRKLWCGLRHGHDYRRGGSDYLRCRKCGRIRQWEPPSPVSRQDAAKEK
jgi:hypothetical protein